MMMTMKNLLVLSVFLSVSVWCSYTLESTVASTSTSTASREDTSATLHLQWIDQAVERHAICNDGSIGGFYHTQAIDVSMQQTFLVFLPGGGQCFDEGSCATRWDTAGSTYMSSKGWSDTIQKSGIFDTHPMKSPLWGANKVMLGYCSSDGYMGDVAASDETWGWHFRGQALVIAMIQDIIQLYNMTSNTTIVLGGGSAGARGMMTLVDLLVREYLPVGAKIVTFLDSPYYMDMIPYSTAFQGFPYQEQQKYMYYNTSGIIAEDCAQKYNATSSAEMLWKCQFGQYRMPFVHIPFFLIASQYDSYQLSQNTQTNPPYMDASLVTYTDQFAAMTREGLRNLTSQIPSSSKVEKPIINAVFSWTCYNHDMSETSAFATTRNNFNLTENEALGLYLKRNPFITIPERNSSSLISPRHNSIFMSWIGDCGSMSCGQGCSL